MLPVSLASGQMLSPPHSPAASITGPLNFRDLGGYAAGDYFVVRRDLVFRSGELSRLSDADFQSLSSVNVGYVFDLRTDGERDAAPTAWQGPAPVIMPIPVGFDAKADPAAGMKVFFATGATPVNAMEAMRAVTAMIAIDGAPEIGTILHTIAGSDSAVIIHCTAGKDRTGVVSAILLTLLGVPKETVYQDYLRSNEATPAEMARLQAAAKAPSGTGAMLASAVASIPMETIRVLMGVDRSYLDAAFAAVDSKYGSFDGYFTQGLKLTPADIQTLRTRLLEPAR